MARLDASAADVFERHLDLAPLRGRRRGLTRCPFHDDHRASLSVDLDRGVFNCFACGARGGWRRFGELIGESPAPQRAHRAETEPERARRAVLARERGLAARRVEWLPWQLGNDQLRRCANLVREVRTVATCLGPERPGVWGLLERAARVERGAWLVEAELDAILAEGPLQ
jgi:CHC2-type zinc finger protein